MLHFHEIEILAMGIVCRPNDDSLQTLPGGNDCTRWERNHRRRKVIVARWQPAPIVGNRYLKVIARCTLVNR